MAIEDDDRPLKKTVHEIGSDLSLLSVEELEGAHRSSAGGNRAVDRIHQCQARHALRRRQVFIGAFSSEVSTGSRENASTARLSPNPERIPKDFRHLHKIKLSRASSQCVQLLDIEWLLSTLFDASLLST